MIKRLLVVLACLTMLGCATSVVPTMPTRLGCDGTGACIVNIVNPTCATNPCSAHVDVDPVTFRRGKNNIQIHWKLPNGFAFCAETGDGVFLKEPDQNDQFKDPGTEGEQGSSVCKRKQYKWTAKNTVINLKYSYKIIFHNAAGTQLYIVDPVMINE